MREASIDYQKLCADLCDAVGTARYFLSVKQDPAGALEILDAAQKRAAEDYLSSCGPIYGHIFDAKL